MAFSTIGLLQSWPKYQPPPSFTYEYNGVPLTPLTQNGYNIIILDSSGTLTFPAAGKDNVNYYVVGGGGGGGRASNFIGGNGGNGGVVLDGLSNPFNIPAGSTYTVNIGSGGRGGNFTFTSVQNGGTTSIMGPSLNVSCNGGFAGKSDGTDNVAQTGGKLGGKGGKYTGTILPSSGLDGVLCPPINQRYGASGGGVGWLGSTFNTSGGDFGGGNGKATTTTESNATKYGGGGGAREGTANGNGYKGCVFLYWPS